MKRNLHIIQPRQCISGYKNKYKYSFMNEYLLIMDSHVRIDAQ